jgi:hypothetical protein
MPGEACIIKLLRNIGTTAELAGAEAAIPCSSLAL